MDPKSRTLLRVTLPQAKAITATMAEELGTDAMGIPPVPENPNKPVDDLIETLMGKNSDARPTPRTCRTPNWIFDLNLCFELQSGNIME